MSIRHVIWHHSSELGDWVIPRESFRCLYTWDLETLVKVSRVKVSRVEVSRVKVNCLFFILLLGSLAAAQDLTEDEETVEDSVIEDEDDEAEVEEDEPTDLVSAIFDLIHIYSVSLYICI